MVLEKWGLWNLSRWFWTLALPLTSSEILQGHFTSLTMYMFTHLTSGDKTNTNHIAWL